MSYPSAHDDPPESPDADLSSSDTAVDALLKDDVPDWEYLPFELDCPRCGYNLRGLPRPRCPECGFEFEWRKMIAKKLSGGDFLFEHRWRWKPVRSWLQTLLATFLPKRYWKRVSLYDPVRPWPLVFQLVSTVVAILFLMHVVAAAYVVIEVRLLGARAQMGAGYPNWFLPWDATLYHLWYLGRWPIMGDPRYLHVPASLLLSFLGVAFVLFLMHQTFGRCRLRKAQILRVIASIAGPACTYVAVMLLVFAFTLTSKLFTGMVPIYLEEQRIWRMSPWRVILFVLGIIGFVGLLGALLSRALSDYLHLPRARLVAYTSAVVGVLFSYTFMLFFGLLLGGRW